MGYVLMERAAAGPPSGAYVADVCAIDDALHVDARSLTLVHGRFPGFFPYHIIHNLLGGHYSTLGCTLGGPGASKPPVLQRFRRSTVASFGDLASTARRAGRMGHKG